MKNVIVLTVIAICMTSGVFAQELSVKNSNTELSKDAEKSAKKGELNYMGAYWNGDQTEMYSFYLYTPKKGPLMMDVAIFDNAGNFKELRSDEFTAENLAKYKLEPAKEITEQKSDLAGKKVAYFKRPVFPGKPTLNYGYFEDRYTNGLWSGYEFVEEGDEKVGPKFWPFFTVALGGDQEGNDNYLLAKVNKWGRLFEGNRNYVGMDEKVVIGGQKAEMKDGEARIFLLGIFNMATKEWESQQDIDMGAEILPGLWSYHKDEAGNVHCLVGTKEAYYVLQVDKSGTLMHKVKMSIPVMGNGLADYFTYKSDGSTLYVAASHFATKQRGGDPGIGISKIEDGKEVAYMSASNEELENAMLLAKRSKAKFKKEKYIKVDRLDIIPGGYMLFFSSANRGAENDNYAAQFNAEGQLVASYAADGIDAAMVGKGGDASGGHQMPIIALKGNKLYWLMRSIPQGWQQGIHFDTDYEDLGTYSVTTTTTLRNDETFALGNLVVIDIDAKTISNQVAPEEALIGANPMLILPNGNVLFNAVDMEKSRYKNLFVMVE